MKYLFRVLLILALSCGFAGHARADAIDFHVQVLDPPNSCDPSTSLCTIADPSQPITVTFLSAACTPFGLPNGPTDGCLVLGNNTLTTTFTNLELIFAVSGSVNPTCGTDGVNFASAICGVSGGVETFFFSGGPGLAPLHQLVIFESGVSPDGLVGIAAVNTPEPESLLLFSTGAMMMMAGLFLKKQPRFAFRKK
jgi:hypothetical protein